MTILSPKCLDYLRVTVKKFRLYLQNFVCVPKISLRFFCYTVVYLGKREREREGTLSGIYMYKIMITVCVPVSPSYICSTVQEIYHFCSISERSASSPTAHGAGGEGEGEREGRG